MAGKQEKIGQIVQKQGRFQVFIFHVQLNFFPVFWKPYFFPPPGGGGLLAKIFTLGLFRCGPWNTSVWSFQIVVTSLDIYGGFYESLLFGKTCVTFPPSPRVNYVITMTSTWDRSGRFGERVNMPYSRAHISGYRRSLNLRRISEPFKQHFPFDHPRHAIYRT